ncbi:hypothetical protein [Dactylosporangium sp. NPDC005555]|uniref:hypothetical protein n=1 Tax=Dactylosporangium sp. NPDC005555 TaxID=3154889 RepID=UPI0033BDCDAA
MLLFELACELNLDFPTLYQLGASLGFPDIDQNIPLTSEAVAALRAAAPAASLDAPPRRYPPRVRHRPRQPEVKVADLSLMARSIYRAETAVFSPHRSRALPRWITEAEAQVLERQALAWAACWFEPADVERWIVLNNAAVAPEAAAEMRRAGISAEAAAIPLWYGKVRKGHRSIAQRVHARDVTADEAAAQLRAAGLLRSAA